MQWLRVCYKKDVDSDVLCLHAGPYYQPACTGVQFTGKGPNLDILPQLQGLLDLGDLVEVLVIGDAQCPHPVLVAPLLEVPLKFASAPVGLVAADLALKLLHQPGCHSPSRQVLSCYRVEIDYQVEIKYMSTESLLFLVWGWILGSCTQP